MLTSALRHDSPRFRALMRRVHGRIGDVCSDSANACRANASLVAKLGGKPFLMPRKKASSKARGHKAWKEMMLFREEHPRRFKRRYHKRSNAESTNSSFKGRYGDDLYSRTWYMQKREAGLKVIAHNIRQLIRFRIRLETKIWD